MIGFPNHKYLNRMAEPQKMVVYRRFERKNRKYEGGWEKNKGNVDFIRETGYNKK